MNSVINAVDGYKTYAAAVAAIVYAVSGALLGYHDWNTAAAFIFAACGTIGIGHKIDKATPKPLPPVEIDVTHI